MTGLVDHELVIIWNCFVLFWSYRLINFVLSSSIMRHPLYESYIRTDSCGCSDTCEATNNKIPTPVTRTFECLDNYVYCICMYG